MCEHHYTWKKTSLMNGNCQEATIISNVWYTHTPFVLSSCSESCINYSLTRRKRFTRTHNCRLTNVNRQILHVEHWKHDFCTINDIIIILCVMSSFFYPEISSTDLYEDNLLNSSLSYVDLSRHGMSCTGRNNEDTLL